MLGAFVGRYRQVSHAQKKFPVEIQINKVGAGRSSLRFGGNRADRSALLCVYRKGFEAMHGVSGLFA